MIRALLRPSLCSAVAISALVGYLAAGGAPGPRMAWLATGIMLAATGATILNQWQERHIDALMDRTRHRPLACGRLNPRVALGAGLLSALAGILLLTVLDSRSGWLTLCVFLLYHLIYTPLKRHTILALLPGSLCGALPPVIGWLAGGGSWQSPRLAIFSGLMLLWQIPHSWHILLRDRRDLHRAGLFPELHRLPPPRLRQLILVWISALTTATLAIPALLIPDTPTIRWMVLGLAAWPLAVLITHRRKQERHPVAGWQGGAGVFYLGALMILLLLY